MTVPGREATSGAPAWLEPRRLQAVRDTGLLDAAAQASWDGLTRLASRLLGAPMAFMTLVDEERSFWLSSKGAGAAVTGRQSPVEESFCQYVIADRAPFLVSDATEDPRTRDNPSVTSLGVRAWAGHPVLDAEGNVLGTFCVMDTAPRAWSEQDVETLGILARAASAHVVLLGAIAAERGARHDASLGSEPELHAADRLEQLMSVALELLTAETAEDLAGIVVNRGLPVLSADGGAVLVNHDGGDGFRLVVSDRLGPQVQLRYAELPYDSPLPARHVARTGTTLVIPDRAAGVASFPLMEALYEETGRLAWVFSPLRVGDRLLGALAAAWVHERTFSDAEVLLVDAFAAQCALALERIRVHEEGRRSAHLAQHLSEAVQRSMLTQPPTQSELDIAVRYLPAVAALAVGGDWFDAFKTTRGSTYVSVGDVSGHDGNSAAVMAQLRNLLRGLAVDSDDSPAVLLTRLDTAIDRLGLDALATALLARVDTVAPGGGEGFRLRWSSAGHLPPMVRLPDGQVRVLSDDSDLMLGIDPGAERVERVTSLPQGSTLLLCTDGLVERRKESISVGLQRLADVLAAAGDLRPEEMCDHLVAEMLPEAPEDDIALLVLSPRPH